MEILIKGAQLILSLSILVVLHELGHFLPARWFGTRVEKFYLFFDPGSPCGRRTGRAPSSASAGCPSAAT
jgi:membrane-associated protease RseP (regulator of RpoE activity)